MAYTSYTKLWESDFDSNVSKKDKIQDLKIIQWRLQVHDTYKKVEKTTTDFEPPNNENVINKIYLNEKIVKHKRSHIISRENYNEFKLQYIKQSVEEILIQKAFKTTIQIFYGKGLFDKYANAAKVLEIFLFVTRRRGDLEEVKDDIQ